MKSHVLQAQPLLPGLCPSASAVLARSLCCSHGSVLTPQPCPPQFSLILKHRLCELGEQSAALGNSWTELCLCLVSETPWEGGLLSHLVDTVGRRSSETTWNIFCPPAAKFVWHLKAHFLILKTIT